MTTDIKTALTDIAETNCNIIGLTCAAAVDHIEEIEAKILSARSRTDHLLRELAQSIERAKSILTESDKP